MNAQKSIVHLLWGVALVQAGLGVFYRIPYVMPQIEKIEYFYEVMGFIRFCFYLMAVLLIGGGSRKIYQHFKPTNGDAKE